MLLTYLEISRSMTTQDMNADVEVIKDLEERGIRGLDTLSLEELQLLTERKRRQLQLEATERKTLLESEQQHRAADSGTGRKKDRTE
jgi:hypothetical protein